MGNMTRDPEIKYIPSGLAVCEIGLAINDKRKGQNGEWIEDVTFVDVTLWGRQAEVCSEYLSKGAPILIEGRLKLDQWEKDGQKRQKLRVVAENMRMLGGKKDGGGSGGRQYDANEAPYNAGAGQQGGGSNDQGGGGDYSGGDGADIPFAWLIMLATAASSMIC